MAMHHFLIKYVDPRTGEVETTDASFCSLQAKTPEQQAEEFAFILAGNNGYKITEKTNDQ